MSGPLFDLVMGCVVLKRSMVDSHLLQSICSVRVHAALARDARKKHTHTRAAAALACSESSVEFYDLIPRLNDQPASKFRSCVKENIRNCPPSVDAERENKPGEEEKTTAVKERREERE